jgi:lysozyme
MTIATLAAYLIRVFEGFRSQAYWDANGKRWTIGFGHTYNVKQGDICTIEEAIVWMEQDFTLLIYAVKDRPLIEAAALVSFGYNCGIGALKRVLDGEISILHEEFMVEPEDIPYGESSGGVTLAGLQARRHLEAALIEASRQTVQAVQNATEARMTKA